MSTVVTHKLTKSFGFVNAVKDVSIEIPDGAFVTLLGPSGCGKSFLAKCLAKATGASQLLSLYIQIGNLLDLRLL